jgi:hypothetical protein
MYKNVTYITYIKILYILQRVRLCSTPEGDRDHNQARSDGQHSNTTSKNEDVELYIRNSRINISTET